MVCKNVWLSSVELSQDTWPWPARKIFQINTGIWCGNDAVVQQWILWILISSEIFQQQKTMSSETSSTGSLVSPESGSKSRRQTKWQFLKINKETEYYLYIWPLLRDEECRSWWLLSPQFIALQLSNLTVIYMHLFQVASNTKTLE